MKRLLPDTHLAAVAVTPVHATLFASMSVSTAAFSWWCSLFLARNGFATARDVNSDDVDRHMWCCARTRKMVDSAT